MLSQSNGFIWVLILGQCLGWLQAAPFCQHVQRVPGGYDKLIIPRALFQGLHGQVKETIGIGGCSQTENCSVDFPTALGLRLREAER